MNKNKHTGKPFLTIAKKDTVFNHQVYSANILLHNVPEGYSIEIFNGEIGSDTMRSEMFLLSNGTQATYTTLPTTLGMHRYKIFVVLSKRFPNNDSLDHSYIDCSEKYWVK
jgi:hypothetical protein